jgi:putative oxidoreductase
LDRLAGKRRVDLIARGVLASRITLRSTRRKETIVTDIAINRLYLPRLAPIYDRLRPLAWPMLRIAAGLVMIPHGVPKLFGTFAPVVAKNVLAPMGFPEPLYVAYFLGALEIFGGGLLAAGFLTRLLAAMFAFESAIIFTFVNLPKGWFYSVPGGGAEFPALLIVLYLALLFVGAEKFSVDAGLKREL